jgi:Arc/MetJ family transcription regulator
MGDLSLLEHLGRQSARLCEVTRTDSTAVTDLLADLLGPAGSTVLSDGPAWPSGIADDHTPVEFSVAFNRHGGVTLRLLGEALASPAGTAANLAAAYRFLDAQADRFGLATSRFARVRDLFAKPDSNAAFALWFSLVFSGGRHPEFKVYLNPELRGVDRAPELVAEAARRLGVDAAYRTVVERACRPGEFGRGDRLSFFALDLHDGPHARIKLYFSQHDAEISDVVRAAGVVDGIETGELAAFCAAAGGGPGPFSGRPLVSSYTFAPGVGKPIGYSVYVPVRSYVSDDEEARDRVAVLMDRHGFDAAHLDAVIAAVAGRSLREGSGQIAHASLRLGPPTPGMTVYLSSEAYQAGAPRSRPVPVS